MASQATSAASLKCCCTRGHPASCWDRLLCCAAGAVFVCMVWGLCPCAFSSLSPLYRILRFPLPPFLHTLVVAAFPSPVNVDVRILLCNLEPPPWKAELAGTLTTHQDQVRFPLAHAASPCLVESVTLYRIFCYCLKHWGPVWSPPPACSWLAGLSQVLWVCSRYLHPVAPGGSPG